MRLRDRVAIVTGAAQGIGRAYALRFAREGAHVVVADIRDEQARAVAAECQALGPWGINVNAIAPGVTMTEATKKIVPEEIASALVMFSALRKALEPEDLAGTAVFLASEDSDLMTGQVLVVDGGMIMLG